MIEIDLNDLIIKVKRRSVGQKTLNLKGNTLILLD